MKEDLFYNSLTSKEKEAAENWILEHDCAFEDTELQPDITYETHQTDIGTRVIVKCSCGASEDITDYGSW